METFGKTSTAISGNLKISAISDSELQTQAGKDLSLTNTLFDGAVKSGEKVLKVSLGDADYYVVGTAGDETTTAFTPSAVYSAAGILLTESGQGLYLDSDDEGGYTGFMSSAYLAATAGIAEDDEVGEVELETLEGRTVEPETTEIDVNNLEDGVYPVAFDRGDVAKLSSGTFMNAVRVYTEDWYDIVDINTLAAGDTIVVGGESIAVNSVDRGDKVAINGGLDAGGIDLISVEDSNGYRVQDYDDASSYTLRGTATLTLAENATFTDGSDIESDPVTAQYEGIVEALNGAKIDFFSPNNTTVRIENGRVVEINRVYVP